MAMGADLHLTSQVLDDLMSAFCGFSGQLATACADIRNGDGALTGSDPLAGQVHEFADSWHYGLTQLGQHGTECVRLLQQVGATFDRLDHELTSGLSRGNGHG
jgi:hypothetical protein